ncbi:MAG: hypothetical protein ACTSQP_18905 [Promethearchaeota archaeon]
MGNNDEEDLFNALMSTPTSDETKKEQNSEDSDEKENINELLAKYKEKIIKKLITIPDLESFLKKALGSLFDNIWGAFTQYKENTIDLSMLVHAGIVVLGNKFIASILKTSAEQSVMVKESNDIKPKIKIPTALLGGVSGEKQKESQIETNRPIDSKIESKSLIKDSQLFQKDITISSTKKESVAGEKSMPEKIESVAPKQSLRSSLEALEKVSLELEKVKLEPIRFDEINDSEIKSVNVGLMAPGSTLFEEFSEVESLIHQKQYDLAEKKLKDLIDIAKNRGLEHHAERAEDMLLNMNIYKMLPSLIEAGDEALNKDLRRAEEKYNKAMKFAKILGDSFYISKLDAKLTQVNQRKDFLRKKEILEKEENQKIRKLIKDNIVRLGKEKTLSSIADIRKYCSAKSEELVEEILIEMIKNKEIYAKYFPGSKKVLFDKESNREFLIKIK